jgi:hypothetical protein
MDVEDGDNGVLHMHLLAECIPAWGENFSLTRREKGVV